MAEKPMPARKICENCNYCEVKKGMFKVVCYCYMHMNEVDRYDSCDKFKINYDKPLF